MTKLTAAFPDLHGRFDLLEAALRHLEDEYPGGGKVVFLGDYVDRGPQSRQVIERLMSGPPPGWEWICLKGNHEDMMLDAFRTKFGPDAWVQNGGAETLASYLTEVPPLPPEAHLNWMDGLAFYHEDEHRVYVHADVDPSRDLDEQSEVRMLWTRRHDDEGYRGKHVVHGHTPVHNGPILGANRTNLDSGAVFYGRLTVGLFNDDKPGGPFKVMVTTDRDT